MVGMVQLVSAPDCGSGCRGFESHYTPFSFIFILAGSVRYKASMGYRQAVRHRTLTPAFAGSNPASPVYLGSRERKYGRVAQVVEHLTFNQVVRGSNPRTLTFYNIFLCFFAKKMPRAGIEPATRGFSVLCSTN